MRKITGVGCGIMLACMVALGAVGCTALNGTGNAAYTVASKAVTDYCALPLATRAVGQLVVLGKVYNSGVCTVIKGDADLQAQLATAAASQINALIAARVEKAIAAGTIDRPTANLILAGEQATSTAAQEAVSVTATAAEGSKAAAAVVTDPQAPTAVPAADAAPVTSKAL